MNASISLAMVDDHQIVIDGLLSMIKDEPGIRVTFATIYPEEVLEKLKNNDVDVLLMDMMMPAMPGNILAPKVLEKFPDVKILILSMSGQGEQVDELINNANIAGYALKNIGKRELITAIKKIAAGGIYFADDILVELQKENNRKKRSEEVHLTAREIEIIGLIEKEYSNRKIADTLFISERTVETHRKNIFRKTNTSSVLGLIKFAYEQRIVK
ncbi:MAG: response regulator transcription factor [Ferruginibacter sp.]